MMNMHPDNDESWTFDLNNTVYTVHTIILDHSACIFHIYTPAIKIQKTNSPYCPHEYQF